jgi:hypothetical protein
MAKKRNFATLAVQQYDLRKSAKEYTNREDKFFTILRRL